MGLRTDLRLRTIATLEAAALVPAGHVHDSKVISHERVHLPAISVFTLFSRREGTPATHTAPQFDETITLTVEVAVDGETDPKVAATIDTLCEQIEEALLQSVTWLRGIQGIPATSTEIRLNSTGDKRTAGGAIAIEIVLGEIFEPVIADKLLSAGVGVDVIDPAADPNVKSPGPDGRIEARLELEFPAAD